MSIPLLISRKPGRSSPTPGPTAQGVGRGPVPVIAGGVGVCHSYVDPAANLEQAVPIIHNSKVQRPSACNALDTLLVHREIAPQLLPLVGADLVAANVELRADPRRRGPCRLTAHLR